MVKGPATVEAGAGFPVEWTGPNANGDYVTIVPAGAAAWTDESYFYTSVGSPGTLVAPAEAGPYALWYVSGADDSILTRVAIQVTPFQGAFAAPASVVAGTQFKVGWKGPNGPRDYVTIVPKGAKRWTDESYFYTTSGNPGALVAPVKAGPYQLWYVTGQQEKVKARQAITVTPYTVTLDAPDTVAPGAQFQVAWTGPNGPTDYITIVPAGSPVGTYASYVYTNTGSPVTLTAPDTAGDYEIWYASDRVAKTFAKIPIKVQ
jgi:Ca-activated chloride channel homolog